MAIHPLNLKMNCLPFSVKPKLRRTAFYGILEDAKLPPGKDHPASTSFSANFCTE
jgi:hypothetical protein